MHPGLSSVTVTCHIKAIPVITATHCLSLPRRAHMSKLANLVICLTAIIAAEQYRFCPPPCSTQSVAVEWAQLYQETSQPSQIN